MIIEKITKKDLNLAERVLMSSKSPTKKNTVYIEIRDINLSNLI